MIGRRVKGVLATLSLLVVIAGVPWFLYALGGRLPTTAPSVHQVGSFLGQPITDTAILRGVGYFCWAVWILFVAALAAEAVAWVRARPGPSATNRGFRIPGLQGAAGSLFLAAIVLLPQRPSTAGSAPWGVTSRPSPAGAVLTGVTKAAESPAAPLHAAVSVSSAAPEGRVPYTVKRYDTPWGIAEECLGNGLRWREITDVDDNTLATGVDDWVQINGRLIDEPQARLIYPGQILYLPTNGYSGPRPVQPTLEPPHTAADPVKEPRAAGNQQLYEGASVARPTASDPDPPTPSTTFDAAPAARGSVSLDHQAISATDHDDRIEMVGLLAAGIVAGATVTTITRLRLTQSRARTAGRRIRIPIGELASKEMALRVASRDDLIEATHRALHGLVADLKAESLPAPIVHAVLAGEDQVEVLLARPARPPTSWRTGGDGFRWSIRRDAIPYQPVTARDPLPTLVPVGRLPGTTTEVMINLEAAGIVGVRGNSERSAGLVMSAALAVTGLPWASSAEVIVVGFGESLSLTAPHLRFAATLDDLVAELEATPGVGGLDGTLRGNLTLNGNRPDGWLPTIVLSTKGADHRSLNRLRSLVDSRPGTSVLISDSSDDSGWRLNVDTDFAFIPQLRVALELTSLPSDDLSAITQIVDTALDTEGVTADDPPYSDLESSSRPPLAALAATRPDQAERIPGESGATGSAVRINVLGIMEFVNVDHFRRPRSQETTLYLAMHPQGVSEAQLDEKIWPTRAVPPSTRDPVISAVRAAIGGVERFPHATGQGQQKVYRFSSQVGTDWSHFCDLYRHGRKTGSVEPLRAALELVRGRPFGDLDGGPGYQWLHTEGHVRQMQAEIADCADLTAGMYLDSSQPVEARWAATQGLLADPYAERLWVRLMAAADALGEPHEVERLLKEMDVRMGLDGDFESLHPDTIAAYRRYSRRRG